MKWVFQLSGFVAMQLVCVPGASAQGSAPTIEIVSPPRGATAEVGERAGGTGYSIVIRNSEPARPLVVIITPGSVAGGTTTVMIENVGASAPAPAPPTATAPVPGAPATDTASGASTSPAPPPPSFAGTTTTVAPITTGSLTFIGTGAWPSQTGIAPLQVETSLIAFAGTGAWEARTEIDPVTITVTAPINFVGTGSF
jgi:hypothetical protein